MYSDACIRINSHAEVTESGFITDLPLFISVAIYNKQKHWKCVSTHFNTENTKLRETPKQKKPKNKTKQKTN